MVAGRFLAEGLGPETVAVTVFGFPGEGNPLAGADLLLDAPQVCPELIVMGDAQVAVLKVLMESIGEALFFGGCEHEGLDLPRVAFSARSASWPPEPFASKQAR